MGAFALIISAGFFQLHRRLRLSVGSVASTIAPRDSVRVAAGSSPEVSEKKQSAKAKVTGSSNVTGNVNQNGDNNIAVIGTGNSVNAGPKLSGWLVPAAEPLPAIQCVDYDAVNHAVRGLKQLVVPPGYTALLLGDFAQVEKDFPRTIIRAAGVPRFLLEKTDRGELAITLDIFDSDPNPRIIASIERNQFMVNPNNYFKAESDKSSLKVIDQYKTKVLDVRYLNKAAIRVTGVFHVPGSAATLTITDTHVIWKGVHLDGLCIKDTPQEDPTFDLASPTQDSAVIFLS
jgi:hypothetical protein